MNSHQSHIVLSQTLHLKNMDVMPLRLVDLQSRTNTCARIESGNVTMPKPNLPAIEALRNTSIDNLESDMFFYHSDHLGSSSWITDASGAVNQHLQYLPFGEDYIYQRNSSWNIPYTFSGKEKDIETGYSYFGARYYDSDLSVWLSVDPLAGKYPSMSAYKYVAGNPEMLVDPDGRKINLSLLSSENKAKLISELKKLTGLNSLSTDDDGYLTYDKNEKAKGGSKLANRALKKAINRKKEFDIANGESETDKQMDIIYIDFDEINTYSYNGLNELTEGVGMVFFHEISHAFFNTKDPDHKMVGYDLGGAVRFTNKIRKQMGKDFGQKTSYYPYTREDFYESGKGYPAYLIYGTQSLKDAKNKQKPTSQYVMFYHQVK